MTFKGLVFKDLGEYYFCMRLILFALFSNEDECHEKFE
jgi:hypothetical protein